MYSCGGEKRGIILPATERKEVRTQDGAGKAGCGQGTGKSPESHRHPEHHAGAGGERSERPPARGPQREQHRPRHHEGTERSDCRAKDLAGVSKTLNDQGVDAEGRECGVVLLPPVEDV